MTPHGFNPTPCEVSAIHSMAALSEHPHEVVTAVTGAAVTGAAVIGAAVMGAAVIGAAVMGAAVIGAAVTVAVTGAVVTASIHMKSDVTSGHGPPPKAPEPPHICLNGSSIQVDGWSRGVGRRIGRRCRGVGRGWCCTSVGRGASIPHGAERPRL